AGFRGGVAGIGAQLRGLRKRDLPRRAGSGAHRPTRGGADPGLERAPDPDARARSAGVSPGAGADDQRLRRASQRLIAGVSAHGPRADKADSDICHQYRQLGDPRSALCGALPRDVSSAPGSGATPRTALEESDGVSRIVLRVETLSLRRGMRGVLEGVTFEVPRGELGALMVPCGRGKT